MEISKTNMSIYYGHKIKHNVFNGEHISGVITCALLFLVSQSQSPGLLRKLNRVISKTNTI